MSYSTIANIQQSGSLMLRCTASVASEVSTGGTEGDAGASGSWVARRSWDIAATPGWDAKWESAIAAGITDPGNNAGVITDGDILARVQPLLVAYPLAELSPPPPAVP